MLDFGHLQGSSLWVLSVFETELHNSCMNSALYIDFRQSHTNNASCIVTVWASGIRVEGGFARHSLICYDTGRFQGLCKLQFRISYHAFSFSRDVAA